MHGPGSPRLSLTISRRRGPGADRGSSGNAPWGARARPAHPDRSLHLFLLAIPTEHTAADFERIWSLYPEGWKRDAYRLFAENALSPDLDGLPLVRSVSGARRILALVPSSAGEYEVNECCVFRTVADADDAVEMARRRLGFDIVFPDGDYYSAVKNGLHVNPDPELISVFGQQLN